jgi:diadenosine tetraphosphate (Ap4A) HIT family hydrolase
MQSESNCPFCLLSQNPQTEDFRLLSNSSEILIVLSLFPQTTGHLLIIPKKHISSMTKLSPNQLKTLFLTAVEWGEKLLSQLAAKAYVIKVNNLLSDLEPEPNHVSHIHIHVIPRYKSKDNLRLKKPSIKALKLTRDKLLI